MTASSSRYLAVIADIDASNAHDPRLEIVDGATRPREVVYSERMAACLNQVYPGCSQELRIAAHAQHIERWKIPRNTYPLGREGYQSWRTACHTHHAARTTEIMRRHGCAEASITQVAKILKKEDLKTDRESQALENVVAIIFVQFYLNEFIAAHEHYDDDKLVTIMRKTLRKMDNAGHDAVVALPLPSHVRRIIEAALR